MAQVGKADVGMKTKVIGSWGEYVEYAEKYKGKCYFRGQSDVAWGITPSLFRAGNAMTLGMESRTIAEKMALDPMHTPLSALFELQHYGCPTRICDLTISHLCALFFACEGDSDGAVFVINSDTAVRLNSYEMTIFSAILEKGIYSLSELQRELGGVIDAVDVISKNYVAVYRELGYTNPRAFRQGGTGIIFGFGTDGDEITSSGIVNTDALVVEKIIIPFDVKAIASKELRKLGYSKDILYDAHNGCTRVSFTQTNFQVERRYDKTAFNKINAEYRISSLHFDRDQLALEIRELYANLFAQYGQNARIWTFFYFDENDCGPAPNWICRGVWRQDTQFAIEWTKLYYAYRLNHLNEQISRGEAISKYTELVKRILPYSNQLSDYVKQPDYSILGFLSLVKGMQLAVSQVCSDADNVPFADPETETFIHKAWLFINDVDWIVRDMALFSQRVDLKEQNLRWMIDQVYIKRHNLSRIECLSALVELSTKPFDGRDLHCKEGSIDAAY